jgi:hypothetical protein
MITKFKFKSWIENFSIQCKKSQFTSVINERCRSIRCFIFQWTWSTRFWKFIMSSSNSRFHFAIIFEFMLSFKIVKRFDSTISNFMQHKSLSFKVIKLVLSSFLNRRSTTKIIKRVKRFKNLNQQCNRIRISKYYRRNSSFSREIRFRSI